MKWGNKTTSWEKKCLDFIIQEKSKKVPGENPSIVLENHIE